KNATLVIQCHARTDQHIFRFLDFVLEKTRFRVTEIDAEFLQTALASLIANRTIERMIDEEKFHDATLTFLHQRRVGANGHAFGNILCAGNLRTRDPIDDRFPIGAQLRLAIRAGPREPHLDQTHSTIAGGAKLLVVTIARDEDTNLRASFDDPRPLRKLMPRTVNLDVE